MTALHHEPTDPTTDARVIVVTADELEDFAHRHGLDIELGPDFDRVLIGTALEYRAMREVAA